MKFRSHKPRLDSRVVLDIFADPIFSVRLHDPETVNPLRIQYRAEYKNVSLIHQVGPISDMLVHDLFLFFRYVDREGGPDRWVM
jgi:hypothetical protein